MSGNPLLLAEGAVNHPSGRRGNGSALRSAPTQGCIDWLHALHSVGHLSAEAPPPVLAVAEDLHPGTTLQVQSREDRLILQLLQLLSRQVASRMGNPCVKKFTRAQQAANMISAVSGGHSVSSCPKVSMSTSAASLLLHGLRVEP